MILIFMKILSISKNKEWESKYYYDDWSICIMQFTD